MNATVNGSYVSANNMRYDVGAPTKGVNTMRKVCKSLFPLWLFGAFPVAFLTLGSWSYDHRFGHPPVGLWIFSACYALAGVVMFLAATKSATKSEAQAA